ncbi:hypothetical protein GCM10020219_100390 [Nonomuraea dietziae]
MSAPLWPAPTASAPVTATVRLPGSKSVTNRALLLAALADGPGTVRQALRSRDADLMAAAMRALGTELTPSNESASGVDWQVTPGPVRGGARIDVGLAGTVMRFVPPMAALAEGEVHFDGDAHARKRPMGPILSALRALGAEVDNDSLPFTVRGRAVGGEVTIDASASSQLISGLLLTAARFEKGVTIRHEGPPVPSMPHIEMTVQMLRAAGVTVDDDTRDVWRVEPGPISARDLVVEPDLSNAAPFLSAALITGGTVTVPGWPALTTQPGDELRGLLGAMGATVDLGPHGLTVTGTGQIAGIDADLHEVGELTPDHRRAGRPGLLAEHAARHRPPARPRDRQAGGARHRDQRPGRQRRGDRRRPHRQARPAARRHLPQLRRPPHGHGGSRHRARRARRRGGRHRDDG